MKFEKTPLQGAVVIVPDTIQDNRGFFARNFCREECDAHGLQNDIVQCSISYNTKKGTVRGMHYQIAPHEEVKLVSCHRGAIYDVIVDLRKNSNTYGQWVGVELTAENRKSLYIPAGFAHGFQSLCDDSEVFYMINHYFVPEAARGILWNSPVLNIDWPIQEVILSEQDKQLTEYLPSQ